MAIQHYILLFMLPSLIAVCFGLSQQLIWIFGFSFFAHRFWGQEEGGGGARMRGAKRTRAALPGFTLYLWRRVPKKGHRAGAQSGSISGGTEDSEARGEQEGESSAT